MTGEFDRGMSLTQAVKAVNEAGFTIHIDHDHFDRQPGTVGFFKAGDGIYEVVKTVDGIDGWVVQGMSGVVAPGVLTTPDEVYEALADLEPKSRREYVNIERRTNTDTVRGDDA